MPHDDLTLGGGLGRSGNENPRQPSGRSWFRLVSALGGLLGASGLLVPALLVRSAFVDAPNPAAMGYCSRSETALGPRRPRLRSQGLPSPARASPILGRAHSSLSILAAIKN